MASQTEIARLARVSQSVVSRVLSGRAKEFGISDDTAARVQMIAEGMKYQPNHAASMLLGRRTKLIGVIVRSFEDPFLTHILEELNRRAIDAGYMLLVVGCEAGGINASGLRLLRSYRPDAFIVVGSTDFSTWDADFLNSGKLIIQIGLPVTDARVISCGMDEALAAQALVDHLVALGHTNFGVIADPTLAGRWRLNYLKQLLHARGLQVARPGVFVAEGEAAAAGTEAAEHYLHPSVQAGWPTAVIVTGDLTALTFIRHLLGHDVQIPGRLSVASYDDIEFAALARPALTTVQQPVRGMAAASMELIMGSRPIASVSLSPMLQPRESTAAPARAQG